MKDQTILFDTMLDRFNSEAAKEINAVFQYHISDNQSFSCEIKDATCVFSEGNNSAADITLTLNTELLEDIIAGKGNALQAFMEGHIVAEGDLTLAPALVSLFPAHT